MKKIVVAGAAIALLGALALPSQAQIHGQVQVYPGVIHAPPPPRYEPIPGPRHGQVWVPGHWQPYGSRHNWVGGHWQQQPGYVYGQPAWREHDGRWQGNDGRWERRHGERDFDRDGVPNRYDRDRDGDGVPNRYDRRPPAAQPVPLLKNFGSRPVHIAAGGMRCGSGDPLCAGEERSFWYPHNFAARSKRIPASRTRIRAARCLSRRRVCADPAKSEHRKAARRAGAPGSNGPYRMPGARPWDTYASCRPESPRRTGA